MFVAGGVLLIAGMLSLTYFYPVFGTMDAEEGSMTLAESDGDIFGYDNYYDYYDYYDENYGEFGNYDTGDKIRIKDSVGDVVYMWDYFREYLPYVEDFFSKGDLDYSAILVGDGKFPDLGDDYEYDYYYDEYDEQDDWDDGVVIVFFSGDLTSEFEMGDTVVLTFEVVSVSPGDFYDYYDDYYYEYDFGYYGESYKVTDYERDVMEGRAGGNEFYYPESDDYMKKVPTTTSLAIGIPAISGGVILIGLGINRKKKSQQHPPDQGFPPMQQFQQYGEANFGQQFQPPQRPFP